MAGLFWAINLFLVLTPTGAEIQVFLTNEKANKVLTRQRRENSFLEEFKAGNLERECVEERCSYEEAREIFENHQQTDEFWYKYVDGDQCESSPCRNNGKCRDGINRYECLCLEGYKGINCEIDIPKLCQADNGGCQHYCRVQRNGVKCSCVDGYALGANDKSCNPQGKMLSLSLLSLSLTYKMYTNHYMTLQDFRGKGLEAGREVTAGDSELKVKNGTRQYNGGGSLEEDAMVNHVKGCRQEKKVPNPCGIVYSERTRGLVAYNNPMPTNSTAANDTDDQLGDPGINQPSPDVRIVGGQDCPLGQCPWQVLLVDELGKGFCGGIILTELLVLTAAHCLNQTKTITAVVGEFDVRKEEQTEQRQDVEAAVAHRGYQQGAYDNDIAVLLLKKPLQFNHYVVPICLPHQKFAEKVLMVKQQALVSGWGVDHERGRPSNTLQRLTVPYIDRTKCIESSLHPVSQNMFCAGYDSELKDACQGDSGGPHVTEHKNTWFLTGIVSWGEGCAKKGKYGIYTKVSKYIKWIKNILHRLPKCDNTQIA
uniref:coagulation factor X-like n=1 Tax=Pristiophorus japonicus TaxID=55135 RepID=UPI00398F4DB4